MSHPPPTKQELADRKIRAKKWKEFRRDRKFTQIKLAEALGISRRTVQKIEAQRCTPFPETLMRYAALYRKHMDGHKRTKGPIRWMEED